MGDPDAVDEDLVARLTEASDRLDELAEVAELMGDDAGALCFRRESAAARSRAMSLLDHRPRGAR